MREKADIYVISKLYRSNYFDEIEMLERGEYEKYEFDGATYIKDQKYEEEGFWVYVKKDKGD